MQTAADRTLHSPAASPAIARFLRLSARASVGQAVFASLGCGRDRVLDLLTDALGDDRPSLIFGQSVWPPAERPTKIRADISQNTRTKADLLARLAQATPGATLIAASDCGLPLFDLVEATMRSNVHLIYLSWAAPSDTPAQVAREAVAAGASTRAQQVALAQAIPTALPLWIGVDHAPDGGFCVSRVSESSFLRGPAGAKASAPDVLMQDLFRFNLDAVSPERSFQGSFAATGWMPWCLDRLAEEAEISPAQLAAELFDRAPVPGGSGCELPGSSLETARRRFRADRFETHRRA